MKSIGHIDSPRDKKKTESPVPSPSLAPEARKLDFKELHPNIELLSLKDLGEKKLEKSPRKDSTGSNPNSVSSSPRSSDADKSPRNDSFILKFFQGIKKTFTSKLDDGPSPKPSPASTPSVGTPRSEDLAVKKPSTPSSAAEKKPDNSKKRSGSKSSVELLCRICEELVNSDELEEHSQYCAIRHNIDMKAISSDERLKRIAKSIKKKIQDTRKNKTRKPLSQDEIDLLDELSQIAKEYANLTCINE